MTSETETIVEPRAARSRLGWLRLDHWRHRTGIGARDRGRLCHGRRIIFGVGDGDSPHRRADRDQ
jgi:hypothetical protein